MAVLNESRPTDPNLEKANPTLQSSRLLSAQVQKGEKRSTDDLPLSDHSFIVIILESQQSYSLNETERNCDYLLAINFLTAYILQKSGRLKESLNFLMVAERMLMLLLSKLRVETHIRKKPDKTSLELVTIEENQSITNFNQQPPIDQKQSVLSKTLLSNYLLGISLMKNIGLKFTNYEQYQEILDKVEDQEQTINLTFTKEFRSMIEVCIFLPFIHKETPRPQMIPKSEQLKLEYLRPDPQVIASLLQIRQSIIELHGSKMESTKVRVQQNTSVLTHTPSNQNSSDGGNKYHTLDHQSQRSAALSINGQTSQSNFSDMLPGLTKDQILATSSRIENKMQITQRSGFSTQKPKSQSINNRARRNINILRTHEIQDKKLDDLSSSMIQVNQVLPLIQAQDQSRTGRQAKSHSTSNHSTLVQHPYQSLPSQYKTRQDPLQTRSFNSTTEMVKQNQTASTSQTNRTIASNSTVIGNQAYARRIYSKFNTKVSNLENEWVQKFQSDNKVNLQMRDEIDKNISQILDQSSHNFAALYNHPKLVNEMFRKTRQTSWTRAAIGKRVEGVLIGSHLTNINQNIKTKLLDSSPAKNTVVSPIKHPAASGVPAI